MSKAADMGKVSARSSFHLFWGLILSTIISSIGTIIIGNLLTDADMGLYYIALQAPLLIQLFRDWGVGAAMIKYTALYNSQNNFGQVKAIIISGLAFQTILGLLLNVFTFAIAGFLAGSVYDRPGIESMIQVSSLILLAGALTSSAQAVFVGLERMFYNSVSMVVQAVVKTLLMTVLVVVGFGVLGAVLGNVVSLLISGLIGVMLVYLIYKNFPQVGSWSVHFFENVKLMLKYGVPLSVGSIVGGFLLQFYNIVLANFVSDALIGNYSIANTFVVLITFFSVPVATMLFPAFSKLDAKKDKEDLRSVFGFSVRYGSLLVVPVAMLVMVLSMPAVYALFGDKFPSTPLYLTLLAVPYLFSAFGSLSVGNLLNSQGETRLNMKFILLNVSIAFPLSYVLISQFQVVGLILTTIFAQIPTLIISRYWIWKHYSLTIDWVFSAKILFSSAIPALVTYLAISFFGSYWMQLIVGVIVFVFAFLVAVILTKTVKRSDIENLKDMTMSLGPLHKLIVFFMSVAERMMNLFGL